MVVARAIGVRFGLATPNIDALLGPTRLMARERPINPLDDALMTLRPPVAGP